MYAIIYLMPYLYIIHIDPLFLFTHNIIVSLTIYSSENDTVLLRKTVWLDRYMSLPALGWRNQNFRQEEKVQEREIKT